MIPHRLELKNFLPYRTPDPLNFDGIHLACLTGHNGAGKSSLLDAITWVLWGRARSGNRPDDLIHLGQTEMYVQLDFEQEGVIYRVLRQRTAGRRGVSNLNLFIVQDDGTLRSIREPSMNETQKQIEGILRLDYETFINSAYLQQGKADAFTTKNPAERKRILGEILGLEDWAVYEDRVKETLKGIQGNITALRTRIQDIDDELGKEAQYRQELVNAQADETTAATALHEAEVLLAQVAHAERDLKATQSQIAATKRAQTDYQADLRVVEDEIVRYEQAIAHMQGLLGTADTIEEGYATLAQAREIDRTLGTKLTAIRDLDRVINDLERQIDMARANLEADRRAQEQRLRDLQKSLASDVTQDLHALNARIAELEEAERDRDALTRTQAERQAERQALTNQLDVLTRTGREIGERIDRLDEASAVCPLCGQVLDEDHRTQVLNELETERDARREEYRQTRARIADIDEEAATLRQQWEALSQQLAQLPGLRNQAGALSQQAQDAEAHRAQLAETQVELASLASVLDSAAYAQELREQLQQALAERDSLGYDSGSHQSAREQLEQYASYDQRFYELNSAREALPREQVALESAQVRRERYTAALAEHETTLAQLDADLLRLQGEVAEQKQREQEVLARRTEAMQARDRRIAAEQQLHTLDAQRQRRADYLRRLDAERSELALYEDLRVAFGKNGVPTLIIESAIPELEETANRLLSRLTQGRMHLRLTTQTINQDGSARETLDIEISDELGTRAYEMYSGGEAFRIDFALRIALSRLLANRAGAHLRTLFIDEGFGTQDDEGRSRLVEAIHTVQDDFDMVLVITHIDDLRDAFPVHITIEKTPSGSAIALR